LITAVFTAVSFVLVHDLPLFTDVYC